MCAWQLTILPLLLLLTSPSQLQSKRVKAAGVVQHAAPDAAVTMEQGQSDAKSTPQKDSGNRMALTCSNLGMAYLAALPIPSPPPGPSIVPAVALLMCCPTQVWGKLKMLWTKGAQHVHDWQKTDVERLVESVTPALSADEVQVQAEDMQRESILELYNTLVEEHSLSNPSGISKHLMAWVKRYIGVHSRSRFASEKYAHNMGAKTEIEQTYPWVLYPRLKAAYKDERLTQREKDALTQAMRQLKSDNEWLPDLPDQPSANSSAIADIAAIQASVLTTATSPEHERAIEEHRASASVRDGDLYVTDPMTAIVEEQVMQKVLTYAQSKREAMCGYVGRLADRAVTKMNNFMNKPSELQLRDLVARVQVYNLLGSS